MIANNHIKYQIHPHEIMLFASNMNMTMKLSSIKRVVSVFILRPNKSPPLIQHQPQQQNVYQIEVALFRRQKTMPTFPSHWAGISGSIEEDDANPLEAAVRELQEETNIGELFAKYYGGDKDILGLMRSCIKQGLHVDVSGNQSKGAFGGRIIRVYPFALTLPVNSIEDTARVDKSTGISKKTNECSSLWLNLEMRGTEHDQMKFVNVKEFLEMTEPCVPALKMALHHATSGSYLKLPAEIRTWEQDRVNGAAFLARQAVILAAAHTNDAAADGHNTDDDTNQPNTALSIAMLRPSMVPIVNIMHEFDRRMELNQDSDRVRDDLLLSLDEEVGRCVDLAVETILRYYKQWQLNSSSIAAEFVIGTFSRSSTMKIILGYVLQALEQTQQVKVICSQSTPGDEGELMASDIPGGKWLSDHSFRQQIEQGKIHLILVGADCILKEGKGVVNKVGSAALAACCKQFNVPIICCADRWKLWDDDYPPGLEEIFEFVPAELLNHVLVPGEDCRNDREK
mmetsp:Transcript_14937/g.32418  ORF Transcript_14937/g.32418 Transcript_14937/m.32418 type:complete len:512 (+) Transcript_14937:568-2103(+)|eukprot:CAMPEP_0172307506 /NCGR_PEP_ID=MMETSP1058-20130122/8341_1 /TAXON_ID=83371 /ORGANISM="Detonula confervacea, Strain CCMP 353" /LENGTH=511 /DNA_ID=CAMNT_0013019687 /DNA_START=1970 /DNA_END=3505 /DNA_ORIENTATION=-